MNNQEPNDVCNQADFLLETGKGVDKHDIVDTKHDSMGSQCRSEHL